MSTDRTARPAESVSGKRIDAETLRRLVEEGAQLRKDFESRTASTRIITPDDLKIRSR